MQISLTFQEAIPVDCGGLISHENEQAAKSKALYSNFSFQEEM
jgi:hypothetical protein